MRRLVATLAAVVSAALLAPTPSVQASTEVINVTFDGEITLWENGCQAGPVSCPGELWAPTSTNPVCAPLCPVPPGRLVFWYLSTPGGTPEEWVPCDAVTAPGAAASCSIRGKGAIHLTGAPAGPYCYGAWQGSISTLDVRINGHETEFIGSSTAHTWPNFRWPVNEGGMTSDAGVATMTLEEPEGHCGLDPTNPVPMHRTNVTGTITWADPL